MQITLNFPSTNINQSVQIGDTVYYSNPTTSGGFDISSNIVILGVINNISISGNITYITCTVADDVVVPTANLSYIFFSKDNKVNSSSLLGYFGLADFRNNSTVKAELFATAAEIFESSK
tara:strand:- start:1770 stop:2129 length:360 start_codon:yes stop_codon:yes gene_type:complete